MVYKFSSGNNSSTETYVKIIGELRNRQNDNIKDLKNSLMELKKQDRNAPLKELEVIKHQLRLYQVDDLVVGILLKSFSEHNIEYKKIKVVENDINIFLNSKIKFVIFNTSSNIPGPIKIYKNILILPGIIPESLYEKNRIQAVYNEVEKLFPSKPGEKYQ